VIVVTEAEDIKIWEYTIDSEGFLKIVGKMTKQDFIDIVTEMVKYRSAKYIKDDVTESLNADVDDYEDISIYDVWLTKEHPQTAICYETPKGRHLSYAKKDKDGKIIIEYPTV
jgi:hypothetical protein